MKVMITGSTGFLGGHVLKALVDAGHEPVALVRSAEKLDEVRRIHGIDAPIEHVVGDLLDVDSINAAMEGAEACVHSAAFTTLDPAEMPKCLEINEPGTRNVIGAALAQGCDPVVHMSSMSCIFPPVGDVLDPNVDPVHSSDLPYAKSKADSEIYARSLQAEGKPVITLYPAGVSGPTDAGFNILSMMLAGSLAEDFLMSADTGGWSLVDVRDLAQATVAVLQPGQGPKRYMCGGNTVDWATFNNALAAVTGKERAIYPMTRDQLLENIDEEAVDIMLGIRPGNDAPFLEASGVQWRPMEETLRDTIAWLLEKGYLAPDAAPAVAE